MFDNIDRFCITKSSNILYFGSRSTNEWKQGFLKHVTKGGGISIQCRIKGDPPRSVATDHGNVIAFDRSTNSIIVVEKDGTRKDATRFRTENLKPTAMSYNEQNDTILVALKGHSEMSTCKVKMFKLELIN